ncbi:MAG: 2-oxoacid:acceptor oxidoreductase family protein [Candidatus Hydrogenedentes bacterium]|nr:2-oxoacid:acceptor oxidoreductase family protein [Candidatus Hydrogenedentota bacterium]
MSTPKYPGIRITTNGNQLVSYHTETRVTDGGIFYPITASTEMGELYQQSYAEGKLNVFGRQKIAIECEGEHAAQGGAIAYSVTGRRTVNFTSGQGIVYALEQYYHAPGKLSTMVVQVAARALTKHALNVHCGHDDIYAALDTGWIMLFGKDAQQAADQALIIRKVTELSLTPGINIQDGFLTSHLERTFLKHESDLIREFLGSPDDLINCPTEAQRVLFGPKRLRVPKVIDLQHPAMIGPVQNQEHYMNGVAARRNNFIEPILGFLEDAYAEFGKLTGRHYGLVSKYKTDDADTVYVSLGSAAENIEAACDYLRATRDAKVGSIHLNVIRPFPEAAIVEALKGKKQVIILERTDEPLAGDNPMARDIRTALSKALQNYDGLAYAGIPAIAPSEMPHIATGIYGLGSRDFRPEDIIGAYEYTQGLVNRQDGKRLADGASFFTLGIDHPYNVRSAETPSLLPENAVAVRLHSIGGWGMITTGKNLAEIVGEIGTHVADRDGVKDELGQPGEVIHISANPKYGSEKKGSPTSYFLVAAPERVRVNCDLRHVNVVLCCDPRAFTHINPIDGIAEGGTLVWESDETPEKAWTRIPKKYRQEIIDKRIKVYILPGFDIAKEATDRHDLQLRMQGNAFLGAFFKVSPLLSQFGISEELFQELVLAQYQKKFGRFGEAVVQSNMQVMIQGGLRLQQVHYGDVAAMDASSMRGVALEAVGGCGARCGCGTPEAQPERVPMYKLKTFDDEFRAGLGYDQPASPLAAVGIMAAGTGATSSKYGSRRETPKWIPENCTQCMECIAACPDTALPNTAQDLETILRTAITNYVSEPAGREKLLAAVPDLDKTVRAKMLEQSKSDTAPSYVELIMDEVDLQGYATGQARTELETVLNKVPVAYSKVNAVFASREKKEAGAGGVFSIFVSDLCKGCGECVTECGDHNALVMVPDNEEVNSGITSAQNFFDLLPETPNKYLGLYDAETPEQSRQAALRNHLMVRKNYEALVSGDGACAGCGEKSVLHALASITEAYMRPLYHNKARRLRKKADELEKNGVALLAAWKKDDPEAHETFKRSVAHVLMGLGGETDEDTLARLEAHGAISDAQAVEAVVAVLRQTAFNHDSLQALDGRLSNGMSVMAMGAHTGCNTVYGSTPPNNPHPYPWMNSLFQDGATISWLMGESFMIENARFSIVPERLADQLLAGEKTSEQDYFNFTHFTDAIMTDQEVAELPKVWCVGGDGGMGDIGYQNVSKVIVQNRPNVKCLMLDTQVYSNTGGQNSDASPMTGGFDMNQFGKASQGKLVEMKNIAESFTAGHGSPYVGQVSMADEPKFYKSLLDGLTYRGTAFFHCYTTCQPEHGVADDMATQQAKSVRDSRGLPEFTFNPALGETYADALSIKGNRNPDRDWMEVTIKGTKEKYNYTVAHWAATEARFRQHIKKATGEEIQGMILLDNLLLCIEQNDVVNRRYLDPASRSYVPDFGSYVIVEGNNGKRIPMKLSRQMVLFNVERRKAWRMLQSKAGQENKDYIAQREIIKRLDAGKITRDDVWTRGMAVLEEEAAAK